MNYLNQYIETLKKYFVFRGRASRREFWVFVLITLLISIIPLLFLGLERRIGYDGPVLDPYSYYSINVAFSDNLESGLESLSKFRFFETWGSFLITMFLYVAICSIIPLLSCAVRRLHDVGRSGWNTLFVLFPPILGLIILFPLLIKNGDSDENKNLADKQPKMKKDGKPIVRKTRQEQLEDLVNDEMSRLEAITKCEVAAVVFSDNPQADAIVEQLKQICPVTVTDMIWYCPKCKDGETNRPMTCPKCGGDLYIYCFNEYLDSAVDINYSTGPNGKVTGGIITIVPMKIKDIYFRRASSAHLSSIMPESSMPMIYINIVSGVYGDKEPTIRGEWLECTTSKSLLGLTSGLLLGKLEELYENS